MATFRQVHCQFWNDSEVMEFTPEDKLFYLYILTNPRSKQCGITEITIRQMAFELGYSTDTIDTLLIRFQERGKIRYNRETNELAVKNWRKYNPDTSPKVKSCIEKELAQVKDTSLIPYIYSIDTQVFFDGEEREEKEKNKEKDKEREKEARSLKFEELKNAVTKHIREVPRFKRFDPQVITEKFAWLIRGNDFKMATGKPITDLEAYVYTLLDKEK